MSRLSPSNNIYYVYGLKDPNTEEIRYIGITYRPKRRLQDHIQTAYKCRSHKEKWINLLLKNNTKPLLIILEETSFEQVSEREHYWVMKLKSEGYRLTNSTDGGEGCPNPSIETIQKIKDKLSGKRCSGPLTEAGRQKLIDNATGRIFSQERCDNISKAKTGVLFSEEHKQKLSEAKLGKKRKPFTEETLNRMRLAQQKRYIKY